ncbi:MAG: hypothetical protein HHJ12_08820 [Glaciimonas sp.]|nr:hypothetical protein [Glaciimonas sp.]
MVALLALDAAQPDRLATLTALAGAEPREKGRRLRKCNACSSFLRTP